MQIIFNAVTCVVSSIARLTAQEGTLPTHLSQVLKIFVETDEPKSHLFLVHFSVLFLAIFEELIYRIMQKLTKLSFTGKEEERRKMQQ